MSYYFSGRITDTQFATHPDRGTLSQSIGLEAVNQPLEPIVSTHTWQPGDVIFGCSDGLTDMVSDDQIQQCLKEGGSPEQIAKRLIQQALDGGGRDNVTVALACNEDRG